MDPSGAADPLADLFGQTFVGTVGGIVLPGVAIDFVAGEGSGTHVVSNDANGAYMVEFLRLNAPFTVRASKAGYETVEKTHPGITDDSLGFPTNNALHFGLSPQ